MELKLQIQNIEDVKVWEKALSLSIEINNMFKNFEDAEFREKIINAALMMVSNISDYFERSTIPENEGGNSNEQLIQLLLEAKEACVDLRYRLNIALQINYIDKKTGINLIKRTGEISNGIRSLI